MDPDNAAVLTILVGGLVLGVVAWGVIEGIAALVAARKKRSKR